MGGGLDFEKFRERNIKKVIKMKLEKGGGIWWGLKFGERERVGVELKDLCYVSWFLINY